MMKMNGRWRVLGIAGLALCISQPVLGQVGSIPVGTINARIGDISYTSETLDVPSEGTSTAEFRALGPATTVSIQGHDPQAESIMSNVLSLDIMLMGSDASAAVTEATVSYFPKGMNEPFYSSDESGTQTQVVFEALSFDDGVPKAKGSFTALVCRKDDFFTEADQSDCLPVEGTFETALRKAG
ncbi:hypothetical protein QO034_19440 [Sedimentitalea sp. JM2-8]|uniref:Uncharacterized protein n=1 Tax=Sedimentitalea xiamensis TaxID=3050037 RepID=A0ABT7FJF5_9RHOB|nr:hypothetical protein [Sedimentitalea xiamensis]MDK3075264.1 hypothetical protein [Sedimentitalea xiamensis]